MSEGCILIKRVYTLLKRERVRTVNRVWGHWPYSKGHRVISSVSEQTKIVYLHPVFGTNWLFQTNWNLIIFYAQYTKVWWPYPSHFRGYQVAKTLSSLVCTNSWWSNRWTKIEDKWVPQIFLRTRHDYKVDSIEVSSLHIFDVCKY